MSIPLSRRTVSEIMRREVVTLAPDERLDLGDDIMSLGRVRHMPVLEGERLVGMVSHRDVLAASLSAAQDFEPNVRRGFLKAVEVGKVMKRDVVSVRPATPLGDAARTLVERRIGALPVVMADGTLVGLVTETDLLAAAYGIDVQEEEEIDVSESSEFKKWIEAELSELRRARDELRVQAQLAKAEVRDRWGDLEHTLATLEGRVKQAARLAEEPLQQLERDAHKLVRDLREGFRRIKSAL